MSRAVNIAATVDEVVAMSAKHDALISAIEPLEPTGTRVIFMNGEGAVRVARAFGKQVITTAVIRTPWRQRVVN